MKKNLAVIVALLAIVAALLFYSPKEQEIIYDCRMAEISPDFPPTVKQECRKKLYEHIKQQKIQQVTYDLLKS